MKGKIFVVYLLTCLTLFVHSEIKVDSLIWFDAEAYIDTNQNQFVDKGGNFYIGRVYVNLRGDIGKDIFGSKIKGRLTIDFSKPSTPIKYAYFDLKLFDFLTLSAGLMKSEFGYLTYWEYPIPVKSINEISKDLKPSSSADFGVGISGKILPIESVTSNLLYYNIQILNGEGYEKLYKSDQTPPNDSFASHYSLSIKPIEWLTIGGTFRINPYDYEKSRLNPPFNVYHNALSSYLFVDNISLQELNIPIKLLLEYLLMNNYYNGYQNTNSTIMTNYNTSGYAYSFMIGYNLFDFITPYIRYDIIDPDNSEIKTNDMTQILYLGANIKLGQKESLVIKPLLTYYIMQKNKYDINDWIVKLELEYKFGFSIWQ